MTDEITATKAELANDLVSLARTNKDLFDKLASMQSRLDEVTKNEANAREAWALVNGRYTAANSLLKAFKKSASQPNYIKEGLAASRDANKKLKEENKALKQLFILHFKSQELSYTKIAKLMGVSNTTVTSRFKFIKRVLRKMEADND